MVKYNKQNVESFFKNQILPSFAQEAHPGLIRTFDKNLFELEIIMKIIEQSNKKDKPVIVDFGCGLGINLMILSKYFGCECIGIDRYEEFDESHGREVGSTNQVIERLNHFQVQIIEANPVNFKTYECVADIVTSFDVIEHFNFPPTQYLNNMIESLKSGGYILVGTPNQAHIFNRIKLLFGKNVWEDFDYWITYSPFYGHVRELLTSELRVLFKKINLHDNKVYQSSYPLFSRLKTKMPIVLAKLIYGVCKIPFLIFPNFNYYNLIVSKKTSK